MKSDIDTQARLHITPLSITEETALVTWWEALPKDLRDGLKPYVMVRMFEPLNKNHQARAQPLQHR
jgi:hypothetical protein